MYPALVPRKRSHFCFAWPWGLQGDRQFQPRVGSLTRECATGARVRAWVQGPPGEEATKAD